MLQIYRIKLLKGNQCSKDLYNHNKVPAMKSHCRKTMLINSTKEVFITKLNALVIVFSD